jgi:hypothetical protein
MKRYVERGEELTLTLPWSEVNMHMRVAGKRMRARLVGALHGVQLLSDDGGNFSIPITIGEAGLYRDDHGVYVNTAEQGATV